MAPVELRGEQIQRLSDKSQNFYLYQQQKSENFPKKHYNFRKSNNFEKIVGACPPYPSATSSLVAAQAGCVCLQNACNFCLDS